MQISRFFLPGETFLQATTRVPLRNEQLRAIKGKKEAVASLQTKLSREQKPGVPIKRGEAAKRFFTKFGSVKVLIDS